MGSPPRGARSGGHDTCQAARTAATCTQSRGGARCHGAVLSASKFRRGAARQSAATSMAGFVVNCRSAAVQLKPRQSKSLRVDPYQCQRATRQVRSAHARASVCTLLLHAPGLVSCVRQHASCQPCMELFRSCLGFAVLKKNLSLLEGLEFTPAASATTKGDIYVPGTYTKFSFSFFVR